MFNFDAAMVDKVAAAIEDDLKLVTTQPEVEVEDPDIDW